MKRMIQATAMVVLFATLAMANTNGTANDKIAKNYAYSLKSENAGVRHSAIFQLVRMKSENAQLNANEINRNLLKVAKSDDFALIRFHARLAYTYLNDTKLANQVKVENFENPMGFFIELHRMVQDSYLNNLASK